MTEFTDDELAALCEAADAAIIDGGGFGWVTAQPRAALERYFRGVLLVPERQLFVGRLDGSIVGSAQLVRPPRNNEAQAFAATLDAFLHRPVCARSRARPAADPAGRGRRRARWATTCSISTCGRSQQAAIALYEFMGYIRWGVHPAYARVGGRTIRGIHYYKVLQPGGRMA